MTILMKYGLLILLLLSTACGVKGAPAPRQKSAYIFNPDAKEEKSSKDKEDKDGQSKRRTYNRSNNSVQK